MVYSEHIWTSLFVSVQSAISYFWECIDLILIGFRMILFLFWSSERKISHKINSKDLILRRV